MARTVSPRRAALALAALWPVCLASAGCVGPAYRGYDEAMHPGIANPFPIPKRQQVFLFMMNGDDLLELGGMLDLRDHVCRLGFPKVYYAQKQDRDWFFREMRRLERDEPGCRIILLGYDTAAHRTMTLALEAVRDGVPLDAVIFLDPSAAAGDLAATLPVPSYTVRSHHWTGAKELKTKENAELADVGHASLPRHPQTANTVAALMTSAASRVALASIEGLPHLPLRAKTEPTPRGIDPATLAPAGPRWDWFRPVPPDAGRVNPTSAPPRTPPEGTPLPNPRAVPTLPNPRGVPE